MRLTDLEWDVLIDAFALADCEWEASASHERATCPDDAARLERRRKALERAQLKVAARLRS